MLNTSLLGAEIADRRMHLGLSQTELARQAGLSRATLAALERQRLGEIGFSKVSRILAVLGLELRLQPVSQQRPTLDQIRDENEQEERSAPR